MSACLLCFRTLFTALTRCCLLAQYGTISQLIPQGGSVQMNKMGESVPGSQRAVQTAQHWWVGYPEDEPLPGCNIPVSTPLLALPLSVVHAVGDAGRRQNRIVSTWTSRML